MWLHAIISVLLCLSCIFSLVSRFENFYCLMWNLLQGSESFFRDALANMEMIYLNRNPTAKAILELVRSLDNNQIYYDHFAFRTFGVHTYMHFPWAPYVTFINFMDPLLSLFLIYLFFFQFINDCSLVARLLASLLILIFIFQGVNGPDSALTISEKIDPQIPQILYKYYPRVWILSDFARYYTIFIFKTDVTW